MLTSGVMSKDGVVLPDKDIYLTEGSSLTLNCTILDYNQTPLNSTSLYFIRQSSPRVFPSEYYSTASSETMIFHYPNVTVEASTGTYRCYMNDSDILGADGQLGTDMGAASVYVGLPPEPIVNITVVSDNFDNMTVSWPPSDDIMMKYYLTWFIGNYVESGPCSSWQSDFSYDAKCQFCGFQSTGVCAYDSMDHDFHRFSTYNVTVRAVNTYGSSVSSVTFVADSAIVKPSPVLALKALAVSSSSLSVTWDAPMPGSLVNLTYQLRYVSQWSTNSSEIVEMDKVTATNLTGLTPYTRYTITVRCRPVGGVGYWSDVNEVDGTTFEDLPSVAPLVPSGSFRYSSCTGSESCILVVLFWQPISEEERNGIITHYILTSDSDALSKKLSNTVNVSAGAYSASIKLPFETVSVIGLQAFTSVGGSPISYTHFPANFDKLNAMPDDFFAETTEHQDGVYFSWTESSTPDSVNYTLLYCLGRRDYRDTCDGEPNFVTFSGNTTSFTLTLSNPESFVFSMSLNSLAGSNGQSSSWLCVYSYNGLPNLPQMIPVTQQKERSLVLEWEEPKCKDPTNGRVLFYNLTWMEATSDNVSQESLPANTTSYVIQNLLPYTSYTVTLIGLSQAGPGPSYRDNLRTPESKPGSPPQDLTVLHITSSSVNLSWYPSPEPNGLITSYIITTLFNGTEVSNTTIEASSSSTTDCSSGAHSLLSSDGNPSLCGSPISGTVHGLDGFKNYWFFVRARNSAGLSDDSKAVFVTTKIRAPSAVRGVSVYHNDSILYISWSQPDPSNGPLGNYTVTVSISNDFNQTFISSGLSYEVAVPCYDNAVGDGTVLVKASTVDHEAGITYDGPSSEEKFSPCILSGGMKVEHIIAIVVAVVAVVIVGLIVLGVFCQRRQSARQRQMEKGVAIVTPDAILPYSIQNEYPSTSSAESEQSDNSSLQLINETRHEQTHHPSSYDNSATVDISDIRENSPPVSFVNRIKREMDHCTDFRGQPSNRTRYGSAIEVIVNVERLEFRRGSLKKFV